MWKFLSWSCILAWSALCIAATAPKKAASGKAAPTTRKSTAKKSAAKTKSSAKSAAKKTAASKSNKKKAPVRTTWRNRQMAPTPERYRQIQDALAAKGFLNPADATGAWGQSSADALKKFQAAQNIDSTGKINSLSLIALGLGPVREAAPAAKPPDAQPQSP